MITTDFNQDCLKSRTNLHIYMYICKQDKNILSDLKIKYFW